jgi:hypothetical protein
VNKLKLDAESLVVMTFATAAAPKTAVNHAAAASAEITECTCEPYFCINWPSGGI